MVEIFSNYVKHMNRVEFGDYEISSLWSENTQQQHRVQIRHMCS